jgi:hypothetical protein
MLRYDCILTIRCDNGIANVSHPWEHARFTASSTPLKNEQDSLEEIKEEDIDELDEKKPITPFNEAIDSQKGISLSSFILFAHS